jgi:hypothetical protein
MHQLSATEATETLTLAARCLRTKPYDQVGFVAIVTHTDPPSELLQEALGDAQQ